MTTTATAPARQLLLAGLAHATAPLTVTELAEAVGVARSTVSKYLPALEKEGLAVRTPGGRDGRRRLPDHWAASTTPTEPVPDTEQVATAEATSGPAEPLEEAEPAPLATGKVVHQRTHPQDTAPASRAEGETAPPTSECKPALGHARTAQHPDSSPFSTSTAASPAPEPEGAAPSPVPHTSATSGPGLVRTGMGEEGVNPVSGSRRLDPGELKLMVWALLKNSPGEEFTATELSHLLQGRSIGAIQNNLAKLAREGKAELACDKPRRYRFAPQAA